MKTPNKIFALLLTAVVALAVTSCQTDVSTQTGPDIDREGNPVTLPNKIARVISLGPSNTEILIALGFADKIVAADTHSRRIEGIASDIPFFNMMAPDGERIVQLEPDVIFMAGMSRAGGIDPFRVVSEIGICVLYIPTSRSIADIKADIRFIAKVMDAAEKGEEMIAEMEQKIDEIAKIGATITDRKTVYFEISVEFTLYSFGYGVFLHEMLEIVGAENILADRNQWVAITEETIFSRNPDMILTNSNHTNDPVGEIMRRPGWSSLTAVQNGEVHYIDTVTSSRPSHNIVKALQEIAKAVYPDKY